MELNLPYLCKAPLEGADGICGQPVLRGGLCSQHLFQVQPPAPKEPEQLPADPKSQSWECFLNGFLNRKT